MDPIEESISQYIQEHFVLGKEGPELTADYPLIDEGLVGSLAIFQLVVFINDQHGVQVADDEILLENFESVRAIAQLVKKHRR